MSYVRLVRFGLLPDREEVAEGMAEALMPAIRAQPGCHGATFFGDDATRQYGLFVLWDSAESADAAAAVIGPQLQQHLAGHVETPPERRLFKVMGPDAV